MNDIDIMNLWLFKEEPLHYAFEDLVKDKKTQWDGVKNNLAQKNLGQVRKGDEVFFYHTGKEKAIIGTMKVVTSAYKDKNDMFVVDVKPIRRLKRGVFFICGIKDVLYRRYFEVPFVSEEKRKKYLKDVENTAASI